VPIVINKWRFWIASNGVTRVCDARVAGGNCDCNVNLRMNVLFFLSSFQKSTIHSISTF
jgi:hypothetical protein